MLLELQRLPLEQGDRSGGSYGKCGHHLLRGNVGAPGPKDPAERHLRDTLCYVAACKTPKPREWRNCMHDQEDVARKMPSTEVGYILEAKFCKIAVFWDPPGPWGYFLYVF